MKFKTKDIPKDIKRLAIDLGYSGSKKSCGFCGYRNEDGKNLTFSECVDEVVKLINASAEPVLLILEAPLSTCHTTKGNPSPRYTLDDKKKDCFERKDGKIRYWYLGAGAMTTLSAMRFLSVLHKKLKSDCAQIYLAEAMLTFKNKKTS